jgi:hypothetical protein
MLCSLFCNILLVFYKDFFLFQRSFSFFLFSNFCSIPSSVFTLSIMITASFLLSPLSLTLPLWLLPYSSSAFYSFLMTNAFSFLHLCLLPFPYDCCLYLPLSFAFYSFLMIVPYSFLCPFPVMYSFLPSSVSLFCQLCSLSCQI